MEFGHAKTEPAGNSQQNAIKDKENIKVAIRVRPFSAREIAMGAQRAVSVSGPSTTVHIPQLRTFTYDFCYWSHDPSSPNYASQEMVVKGIGSVLLSNALDGFNGCVFAYGQTGSGKSFSIFGYRDAPGFIPWTVDRIFAEKRRMEVDPNKEMRVWVSYLEIYNEHLHDLLHVQMGQDKDNLKVMDHPKLGVYVPDLLEVPCQSPDQVEKLLEFGAKKRVVAATQMNAHSSRSHAVFTMKLQILTGPRPRPGTKDKRRELHSRLNLIDLAGSERQSKANSEGQELREACAINKSLSALGLVIKELSEGERYVRRRSSVGLPGLGGATTPTQGPPDPIKSKMEDLKVPFRASKLTFLLKDSLAGNSKTHMIAAISPSGDSVEETLSTLRFAASVKKIKTVATQNLHTKDGLIDSLRGELETLRTQYLEASQENREQVLEQEKLIKEMMKGYEAQLENANQMMQQREEAVRDMALSQDEINSVFGMDKNTPYLLNMSDDPTLAGCLLYYIVAGKPRTIGSSQENAICLTGIGIPEKLCIIENTDNTSLTITKSSKDGRVVVSGKPLEAGKPVQLKHGQRLFLGRAFAMKVSIPSAAVDPPSDEEDTDVLLLESLDDEWAAIEHSQAWCSLRDYLRYWVQQMPVDQARALTEEVKQAAKACDEANEITAECRKGEGLFFEVDLTSALRMSVVVRVLRSRTGGVPTNDQNTEDWLQLYIWSVSQMLERLDRMRDCYHSFVKTGRLGVDELQDPWHEAWSATIWHRLTDLEKERSGLVQDNRRLRTKQALMFARGVEAWTVDHHGRRLKLVFFAWQQATMAKMGSNTTSLKEKAGLFRRSSSRHSTLGSSRKERSSMSATPSSSPAGPQGSDLGSSIGTSQPGSVALTTADLVQQQQGRDSAAVSSAGSSLAINAARSAPTRSLGASSGPPGSYQSPRNARDSGGAAGKRAISDAGTGATSSSTTSYTAFEYMPNARVTDLDTQGGQLDAVVEAALAAATAAVGSAELPLEVPLQSGPGMQIPQLGISSMGQSSMSSVGVRSIPAQLSPRGSANPLATGSFDGGRASSKPSARSFQSQVEDVLQRTSPPALSSALASDGKTLPSGPESARWPVREAFESLRRELAAHRWEANRLNEDRTQLHEVLGRFERLLERLAPPDGTRSPGIASPTGLGGSPSMSTASLGGPAVLAASRAYPGFFPVPGWSPPDVTRFASVGSPPQPPPPPGGSIFRQISQQSTVGPSMRCVVRVNSPPTSPGPPPPRPGQAPMDGMNSPRMSSAPALQRLNSGPPRSRSPSPGAPPPPIIGSNLAMIARQSSSPQSLGQSLPGSLSLAAAGILGAPLGHSPRRSRSPPRKTPPPPGTITNLPMATVGVDENHDGHADLYYTGLDLDNDGIPDTLRQRASSPGSTLMVRHPGGPSIDVGGPNPRTPAAGRPRASSGEFSPSPLMPAPGTIGRPVAGNSLSGDLSGQLVGHDVSRQVSRSFLGPSTASGQASTTPPLTPTPTLTSLSGAVLMSQTKGISGSPKVTPRVSPRGQQPQRPGVSSARGPGPKPMSSTAPTLPLSARAMERSGPRGSSPTLGTPGASAPLTPDMGMSPGPSAMGVSMSVGPATTPPSLSVVTSTDPLFEERLQAMRIATAQTQAFGGSPLSSSMPVLSPRLRGN